MINNVVLTGRLTKDVELKYTQSGKAVAQFSLAVQRKYMNPQGDRETDFINCVMWGKSAENLANYTNKGALIGVEGSIQTRNYENQQGQRVYVTEILANGFTFLESKKTGVTDALGQGQVNRPEVNKNQNTGGNFAKEDPFSSVGNVLDISDDDLPF